MDEEAPLWLSAVVIGIALAVVGVCAYIVFVKIPEQQAIINKNEAIIRELQ